MKPRKDARKIAASKFKVRLTVDCLAARLELRYEGFHTLFSIRARIGRTGGRGYRKLLPLHFRRDEDSALNGCPNCGDQIGSDAHFQDVAQCPY